MKITNVIVALDNMDKDQAYSYVKHNPSFQFYKIGMELFYKYGREFLEELQNEFKIEVFLDLKLHDIPNTVSKAIRSLQGLPVKFLTIHLSGGENMIKAAQSARDEYLPGCEILGVTYLTSLEDKDAKQIWNHENLEIERLAQLANTTNLDGIVCSAQDLAKLENINAFKVCPGIRFQDEIAGNTTQDQKRVLSPEQALKSGAKYLVMGRSLTQAKDLNSRIEELKNSCL